MGASQSMKDQAFQDTKGIDNSMDPFRRLLAEINPQFMDIGQTLIDRGMGTTNDPFIEAQRGTAGRELGANLGRMGATGGVALNASDRLNRQFDTAQLGGRNEALQSGLNLQQSTLQNTLAEPGMDIAAMAARNAGRGGGGGGKGGK